MTQELKSYLGDDFKNTMVMSALGSEWKSLGESERTRFSIAAEADRDRYEAEAGRPKRKSANGPKRKSANGPKRKLNAYMHFCVERRPAVTASLGTEVKPPAVVSRLAADWRALDDAERVRFQQLAAQPVEAAAAAVVKAAAPVEEEAAAAAAAAPPPVVELSGCEEQPEPEECHVAARESFGLLKQRVEAEAKAAWLAGKRGSAKGAETLQVAEPVKVEVEAGAEAAWLAGKRGLAQAAETMQAVDVSVIGTPRGISWRRVKLEAEAAVTTTDDVASDVIGDADGNPDGDDACTEEAAMDAAEAKEKEERWSACVAERGYDECGLPSIPESRDECMLPWWEKDANHGRGGGDGWWDKPGRAGDSPLGNPGRRER